MRLVRDRSSPDRPLTDEQLSIMQDRVRLKQPVSQPIDTPDLLGDANNYIYFKAVYKQLGGYLAICKECDDDDEAEVTFAQIADIIGGDRKKPRQFMSRLPLPCTNPATKTARFVWKWSIIKERVRQLLISDLIGKVCQKI